MWTGQRLNSFRSDQFERGRSRSVEAAWLIIQWLFISSWLPGTCHRKFLLRLFGARLGHNLVLKPGLKVKFPWRLIIGDNSWIGEDVWIDNLEFVTVGSNACISQGAYFCTGSHNWSKPTFDLVVRPIFVGNSAWIAARCVVGPGVEVGEGAVLALGSVANKDLGPWTINRGNPAVAIKDRVA